jgi:ADP-heptose:LPS heptosyltransferase
MVARPVLPKHFTRRLTLVRSQIRRAWTMNGVRGVGNFALERMAAHGTRRRLARRVGCSLLQRWIDPTVFLAAPLREGKLIEAIALARQRLGRIEQASSHSMRRSRVAWTSLADMLVLTGEMEQASAIYRRVIEAAPRDVSAQWGLENQRRRVAALQAQRSPSALPVHFFTIVLNGMPFIEKHIEELRRLSIPWHWHIVEGIAELIHDTKWSKSLGGRADASLHRAGLSIDGTTEYLDRLAIVEPDRVTIYRPPHGQSWQGKLAMVRAPLANIGGECLLWQIDVDEFWSAAQIQRMQRRFLDDPNRTAAFFLCHFFIKNLVVSTVNTYGNHLDYEWLRVWRWKPGDFWASHEPPQLCRRGHRGDIAVDVAAINPFAHGETLNDNLVFRHLAYVVSEQIRFKEIYYGYKDAVRQWETLPRRGPVRLRDHLAWITDEAIADDCEKYAISAPDPTAPCPAERTESTLFRSGKTDIALEGFRNILIVKLDSIRQAVLLSPFLREFRANAPEARITLMVREQVAEIVALCPYVDRVISVVVKPRGRGFQSTDKEFNAEYDRKSFDLAIVPRWEIDEFGAGAIARGSGARRVFGFSEAVTQDKALANRGADAHFSDAFLRLTPDHAVRQNLALLEYMNGVVSNDGLEAWIGPTDNARADALLSPLLGAEPCVALCPGATDPGKIFPPELLLRILSAFPPSWRFVILGSTAECVFADVLHQHLGERTFDFCGKTSLREAVAILRRCRAAIAMDSALAQVAAAVDRPVAVFSMHPRHGGNDTLEQSPLRFSPWCPEDRRLLIQPEHAWPGCERGCRWRNRGPHCIANIDLGATTRVLHAFLGAHVSSYQ